MKTNEQYGTADFRHINHASGERVSYLQTLKAMVANGGRWHHHWEWQRIREALPSMTEEQAEATVREIERRADLRLAQWQAYQ